MGTKDQRCRARIAEQMIAYALTLTLTLVSNATHIMILGIAATRIQIHQGAAKAKAGNRTKDQRCRARNAEQMIAYALLTRKATKQSCNDWDRPMGGCSCT